MDANDLTNRLRALGEVDVPAHLRDQHMMRIAAAATAPAAAPQTKRFGRVAVAAAALVGFFAGSTGLAMAGALPDRAQGVAHDVLSVVQIDVPDGKEGKLGPCISGVTTASDPRFSELTPDEKKDAKAECREQYQVGPGLGDDDAPGNSGTAPGHDPAGPGNSETTPAADNSNRGGTDKHAGDPCKGKPTWSGPGMTEAERADEKADVLAIEDCRVDEDDDLND